MGVLFITERFPPQPGGAAISAQRIAAAIQASGEFAVRILHVQCPFVVECGERSERCDKR